MRYLLFLVALLLCASSAPACDYARVHHIRISPSIQTGVRLVPFAQTDLSGDFQRAALIQNYSATNFLGVAADPLVIEQRPLVIEQRRFLERRFLERRHPRPFIRIHR